MPNSSAICISGRPLDCNNAMASRLNSSVKLRRGFVIKHPSCPFPERNKGVHQFGGGSHRPAEPEARRRRANDRHSGGRPHRLAMVADPQDTPPCRETASPRQRRRKCALETEVRLQLAGLDRLCAARPINTSALHLSLLAAGIGTGDEVVTVPMTFVATILYAGATPRYVDVEPDYLDNGSGRP